MGAEEAILSGRIFQVHDRVAISKRILAHGEEAMEAITWMEYVGIVAFALSGAQVAVQRKMDFFGVLVLAAITAIGGGMIRDCFIYQRPPTCLTRPVFWWLILLSSLCIFIWKDRPLRTMIWVLCDAIGLAAFVVGTGVVMLQEGTRLGYFLFGTLITGVGGGMIRDVLAHRIPVILRKDIYAVAGLIGAIVLWCSWNVWPQSASIAVSICLIVGVRMGSLKWHIQMPVAGGRDEQTRD